MSLRDQINQDLITAMKARDERKTSVLRLLKSAILAFEVSGKVKVLATENDVLAVLQREAKKRKESIKQFEDGNRDDLASKERAELEILEAYLPAMMSAEDVREVVKATMLELGASGSGDVGKIMGAVMGKLKGKADGAVVKEVVQHVVDNLFELP